jgi:ribosomal protein S8
VKYFLIFYYELFDFGKKLILDKYNPSYYNAVMNLMKQNGYIGNVEVTSNGTYKGHANVSQRITGVDPYDDWAVDFSYNPNNNQLELKATVFDIPLKYDGSIDNEGIEKEIERLTAENREKEQKEIKEIESQAISIGTEIDAYKNNVDGRIIKINKLWWIKINKKKFRTAPLDGATFPYKVRIEYTVNDRKYERSKFIYWSNDSVNIGDSVIVTYEQNNPLKILKLTKKQ